MSGLYHPAKVHLRGKAGYPMHTHSFGEVFWVDKGTCLHRINDRDVRVAEGDCVFIRPDDRHSLHALSAKSEFWVVNIAFQWHCFREIQLRYFPGNGKVYGDENPMPRMIRLTGTQLRWARESFLTLVRNPRLPIHIDSFLIKLLAECGNLPDSGDFFHPNTPVWLQQAWRAFQEPNQFRQGLPHFCHLCDRSAEHVSREFRSHTGITLIQAVTRLRLQYAAALLSGTRMPIVDVALESGFSNLSSFYSQFRLMYGMPPRKYRLNQQRDFYSIRH